MLVIASAPQAIDTGGGMVMVDPPVAIANVLPDSNELRERTTTVCALV